MIRSSSPYFQHAISRSHWRNALFLVGHMVTQDTETIMETTMEIIMKMTMEMIMEMTMEMITEMSITTMKMMDTTRTKLTFEILTL